MNAWNLAADVLIFSLVPLTWIASTGEVRHRIVAFYMGGVIITLLLMLLTMAFHRMPMMDLALSLALMSFGGGIVFAHFLARHLK